MIGNSDDDEINFPHKLFLTNRQVANLHKVFANHTSTNIKLSKTKMQKCGFVRLLARLLKSGLPLLKSVIKPLGILGLTAAASATDAAINKKILGSGTTTLIVSNDEIKDILKIIKPLKDSGVLLKGVTEPIHNDISEQKGGFLSMPQGTLGASSLGDLLTKTLSDKRVIRAGEETIRAGYGSKRSSLKKF